MSTCAERGRAASSARRRQLLRRAGATGSARWTCRSRSCASSACWSTATTGASCTDLHRVDARPPHAVPRAHRAARRADVRQRQHQGPVRGQGTRAGREPPRHDDASRVQRCPRKSVELLPTDEDVALLRRARLVPVQEAAHRRRGRRAGRRPASATTPASATGPCRRRPPKLAYWDPSNGDVQRHNDYVHYEHDGLAKILRKPLIGAVAARLAQADEIRIFQSTLIYKPPIAGRADEHRALALRQALLVVVVVGPDADRVHPVPRLRRRRWARSRWSTAATAGRRSAPTTPTYATSPSGTAPSWRPDADENATYNNAEVRQGPDGHPQGPHELPPLPDVPRQRRATAATGPAGRSRCTCRTATTATASSRCPTAASARTTTTRWSGGPPTAGPTTPIPTTARRSGPIADEGEQHMSRYDWGQTHPGIERLEKAVTRGPRQGRPAPALREPGHPRGASSPSWSTTSSRSGTSCPC